MKILATLILLVGINSLVMPHAKAGTYCNQLGSSPSIGTTQIVIMQAITSNDIDDFGNDIGKNCLEHYDIVMEAANQLLEQMRGQ